MAGLTLTAAAGLAGQAADLSLAWSSPAAAPRSLRVERRRGSYPVQPGDGRTVLDLADLFAPGGQAWARVLTTRFLLANPASDAGLQAELLQYFAGPGDTQPQQVVVRTCAPPLSWTLASSRVVTATGSSAAFGKVETVTVFTEPAGSPEALAGTAVISTAPLAPGPTTTLTDYTQGDQPTTTSTQSAAPGLFAWTPAAGSAGVTVPFAIQTVQASASALRTGVPLQIGFVTSALQAAGAGNLPVVVSAASSASPITITTAAPHGLASGASVSVLGASGNTAANGDWTIAVLDPSTFTLSGSTGNGAYAGGGSVYPPVIGTGALTESANPITGQIDRCLTWTDRGRWLQPGINVYYTAFQDAGAGLASAGAASVLISGQYGFAARLFALLPAVHRFYDDPASSQQGNWQLRRFLQIFGPALDYAQSAAAALPSLYDPFAARAEYLPTLAQTIGWPLDLTLPTQRQRGDLLFAPAVFATIGTVPNVAALAERTTGWTCQVKEYVNNVLLTNAVEPIRLWQIFETSSASPAAGFAPPAIQANLYPLPAEPAATQAAPSLVEARPAAVIGAGGTVWLFWHSTRLGAEWQASTTYAAGAAPSVLAPQSAGGYTYQCTTAGTSGTTEPGFPAAAGATVADGSAVWTCRGVGLPRRRIWLQRLGTDPTPINLVADLADQAGLYDEAPAATSLAGTIWLAWASNRGGHNEIWIRSWPASAAAPGPARPLTAQQVDNRNPALACTGAANAPIWAAWESTQSGQTMIWTSSSADASVTWSAPAIAASGPRDRSPAAVFDAGGQLHLFWSVDGGNTSHIRHATLAGAGWTVSDVTDATPSLHDQAPAAVLWQGVVRLFWHSNRFASVRQNATAYQAGAFVVPANGNGLCYEVTIAGTSGAAPPALPTAAGAAVPDGTAQLTCRGSLANAPLNRRSRIWSASGPGFTPWAPVAAGIASAMQPAAVVEAAGDLRLFLASQESGWRFRSRTVDTAFAPAAGRAPIANLLAKTSIGSYADRLHYTYDTRRVPPALVARDTAVLFLTPNDGQTDAQHAATAQRLRAFLTPFRPINTRLVYTVKQSAGSGFTPVASDP